MNNFQLLIIIVLYFVVRYDVDGLVVNAIVTYFNDRPTQSDDYDESFTTEDVLAKRDYTDYDSRIEALRNELNMFNSAPSNAVESPGVYNIPHEEIIIPIDLEPAVEEEEERGPQEYAR